EPPDAPVGEPSDAPRLTTVLGVSCDYLSDRGWGVGSARAGGRSRYRDYTAGTPQGRARAQDRQITAARNTRPVGAPGRCRAALEDAGILVDGNRRLDRGRRRVRVRKVGRDRDDGVRVRGGAR